MTELADMYLGHDPLGDLRSRNVGNLDILPVPMIVTWTEDDEGNVEILPFSLDEVKKSPNAFG